MMYMHTDDFVFLLGDTCIHICISIYAYSLHHAYQATKTTKTLTFRNILLSNVYTLCQQLSYCFSRSVNKCAFTKPFGYKFK